MIVFQGTLGKESNAVVGKKWSATGGTAIIVQTSMWKRFKSAVEVGNENAHAKFLANSWSAWVGTFNDPEPAHYSVFKLSGGRFDYTAQEVRKEYSITGAGTYNLSVQTRHTNLYLPYFFSASKAFLITNPAKSGTVDASIINTWTQVFTLSESDGDTFSIEMRDANNYPLIEEPMGTGFANQKGWRGYTTGIFNPSEAIRIIQR